MHKHGEEWFGAKKQKQKQHNTTSNDNCVVLTRDCSPLTLWEKESENMNVEQLWNK